MASASSSLREEEASNRWPMYCDSSLDISPVVVVVVAVVMQGAGVTEQAPSDVGDPARSIGWTDCLPPAGVNVVPGEQPGGSSDRGTDLLRLVDDVGLLDCDREERERGAADADMAISLLEIT